MKIFEWDGVKDKIVFAKLPWEYRLNSNDISIFNTDEYYYIYTKD